MVMGGGGAGMIWSWYGKSEAAICRSPYGGGGGRFCTQNEKMNMVAAKNGSRG